jgi:hypothetical protein
VVRCRREVTDTTGMMHVSECKLYAFFSVFWHNNGDVSAANAEQHALHRRTAPAGPPRHTPRHTWWFNRPLWPMTFMETDLGSTLSILATTAMRVDFLPSTLEPRLSNWICRLWSTTVNGERRHAGQRGSVSKHSRVVFDGSECLHESRLLSMHMRGPAALSFCLHHKRTKR